MYYNKFCCACAKDVHCCTFNNKSGFTFVGTNDAKKIKNKTKKEYSEFLDYSPVPSNIVSVLKNDDPSLEGKLRYSQLDKENRLLRLKTKKDGTCVFLDEKKRCTIYNIRPNICRIFPFWAMKLLSGKIKIIEHDEEPKCGIVKSKNKKYEDIEEGLSEKEKKEIKTLFREIKKENKYYKRNIKAFVEEI